MILKNRIKNGMPNPIFFSNSETKKLELEKLNNGC